MHSYPYRRDSKTGLTTATDDFAHWLNRIDATIGCDARRKINLEEWRNCFDLGDSEIDAIEWHAGHPFSAYNRVR